LNNFYQNNESIDEITLLKKIKDGDKDLFKLFFDEYYPQLTRFVYLYVKDSDAAEEIVQEFFVQFWIKKEEITIKTSLSSYFFKAIRNRGLNYLRDKKKNFNISSDLDTIDSELRIEDQHQFDFELLQSKVNTSINSLPEKCREIFLLSRNTKLSYRQIAEALQLSQKTVETQMGIALKKLREKLKPIINGLMTIIIMLFNIYLHYKR